jgi:hypothetical protein
MPRALNVITSAWTNLSAVFRRSYLASATQPFQASDQSTRNLGLDTFSSWQARQMRYLLYWAYYENSAYDSVHNWAAQYKKEYSLYRSTRGVYNPFHRIGEFWADRLFGGSLDPGAGDGKGVPSALPILTENEALRAPLAQLWRDSNLQVNKDVIARMGAVLGDVAIKVCDDTDAGRVTLEVVDPYSIKWADRDRRGNVKAYIIEEWRLDPDFDPRSQAETTLWERACLYREEVFRDGQQVTYATYKDGVPYGWDGQDPEWTEDYGFVPLVIIPHQKIGPGAQWGLSEFHAGLPKVRGVDDLGSHLGDQIRKAIWPKWMFTGVDPNKLKTAQGFKGADATADNPDPGREEVGAIAAPSGATAYPLVFSLDIQFSDLFIQNLIENLERDYPEAQLDSTRVSGDASGKAQVEARRKTTAKVHSRRVVYDDALVRAFQMALAIGGFRGYDGLDGFGLDSYAAGALAMRIGERPVFELDPADAIAVETAFWTGAEVAARSGCPLQLYLERSGWTEGQVTRFRELRDEQMRQSITTAAAIAATKQPATSSTGA